MPPILVRAALVLAAVSACSAEQEDAVTQTTQALATPQLAQGDVRVWKFDSTGHTGIDPRLEKVQEKNVRGVAYRYGATQQITMTGTSDTDNGNIQLLAAELPAAGGTYWKAWFHGNVIDSNNEAIGFCGSGDFAKAEFHAQVQLTFRTKDGAGGICYCNLCPTKDGRGTWCMTNQWQVGNEKPPVSGDGACRAPDDAQSVRVTLEAVAKGDPAVHHRGTAVFEKVVVGRCNNDGTCPDAMTPNDYGQ